MSDRAPDSKRAAQLSYEAIQVHNQFVPCRRIENSCHEFSENVRNGICLICGNSV